MTGAAATFMANSILLRMTVCLHRPGIRQGCGRRLHASEGILAAMESSPVSTGNTESSNAFAKARDTQIRWLLESHPVTAAMLVQIGWFPSKKKALKRLHRLVQRKQIRIVGTLCRATGRPEHVFCRGRWVKPDQLLHEVELTQLCFKLFGGSILRGPQVTDRNILPDAQLWINGYCYYLELDRGTMDYTQLSERFIKYEHCPHLVLWVCSSPARLDGMRQRAERLRHNALFTTMVEAIVSPHDPIWIDYEGQRVALPREGQQPAASAPVGSLQHEIAPVSTPPA